MKYFIVTLAITAMYLLSLGLEFPPAHDKSREDSKLQKYTYAQEVAPIIKMYCLPCHGSDNENPSELYMDDYDTMMKGGKHGVPVVAGKPDESNLYTKLQSNPPFGKEMPRGRKKITPEAVKLIHDWIEQGAVKE